MKTRGIVLHVTRHSDAAVVAHVFTQHYGCVPLVAPRPSAGRGRGVAAAMMQPLTQLSLECDAPSSRMQRLRSAEIDGPYGSLPFVPAKSAMAMFLAEFMWHALRGEQPSESLYEFVALSLRWLDEADEGYANFHLIFLLRLTRYLGYDPTLLPEARQFDIGTLMRHNYRTMRLIPLSGAQRTHFLHRLMAFYREMLPSFPEIRSLEVLSGMYGA